MTPDIAAVIKLQSLDTKAAGYQRDRSAAEARARRKKLESHSKTGSRPRRAAANQRDRKRLEDDIKVQDQKKSKLKDR